MKTSTKKPTTKKSKDVVEAQILKEFLNAGLMGTFIARTLEKEPDNEELRQIGMMFCCGCEKCDQANQPEEKKVITRKPKAKGEGKKKRVLSEEHKQKMQEARLAKKKQRQETEEKAPKEGESESSPTGELNIQFPIE